MSAAPWPWAAPSDDGGAAHLVTGTPMPAVALASSRGGEVDLSRLPDATVLFVYTWTGRPGLANPPDWDTIPGAHGSTPEAEGFRDTHDEFLRLGWRVLGVSTQDSSHQQEFADRVGLPFALLSDAQLRLQAALRLPVFTTGGVPFLKRLTLLVRGGRVVRTIYPVHPPDAHAGEVLAWLRAPAS